MFGGWPGDPAVDVPRVVLDAVAEADLLHHLEVEAGAHAQPLGLEQLALALELGQALRQLGADGDQRALQGLGAGGVVRRREDRDRIQLLDHIAGQGVQRVERLDLVAEHLDADRVLFVDRDDLDGVAAHAELAAREVDVVALVLHVDEAAHELVARDVLADLKRGHGAQVLLGGTEPVDARHRRDDHHVAAAEQRVRGGVPKPLDLGVDRRVLLDEGVGLRHVGLWLVVVVVADEVFDGVVRHQLAELVGELRGEGLVVREHQGRPLNLLDQPGGGRRLSRSGGAEQHDVGLSGVDAVREFGDRGRLIAARHVFADDLERSHRTGGLHDSSLGLAADTR